MVRDGASDAMSEAPYLLVVTRDVRTHPSARYTLRGALARRRRGCDVTVFLTDDAVPATSDASPEVALLIGAGVHVFIEQAHASQGTWLIAEVGAMPATDEDLTDLLLRPGIHAAWC